MERPTFKIGDAVFVIDRNGPSRRTTVTDVKQYKRGPKVTCADGSEWDPQVMRQWGCPGDGFYTGPHLEPRTEELETQFRFRRYRNRVVWVGENFDALTPEQQEAIGEIALRIKKEHRRR